MVAHRHNVVGSEAEEALGERAEGAAALVGRQVRPLALLVALGEVQRLVPELEDALHFGLADVPVLVQQVCCSRPSRWTGRRICS